MIEVSGLGSDSGDCIIFLIGVRGVCFNADLGVDLKGVAFTGVLIGVFIGVNNCACIGVRIGVFNIGVYLLI